jgi:hypothetical protein
VTTQVKNDPNGTGNFQGQVFSTADGTMKTAGIDTKNVNRIASVKGAVSVGGTAGTVALRFASGVQGTTVKIIKGSWGTYY